MRRLLILTTAYALACSSTGGTVSLDTGRDIDPGDDSQAEILLPDLRGPDAPDTLDTLDLRFDSLGPDIPFVECAPGDGCFLDPCSENAQCQASWCVEHMGDGVCTQVCAEECPPGWSCKPVDSGGPDLTYVCVSGFANLCRPCATGADCKSIGGVEDQCLQYGDEGAFCGGACATDEDCPWGFSCAEAVSVDGVTSLQCLADAGVCPCTPKSVALSLSTPCSAANDFGTCSGKRFCTELGLSECDAAEPMEEVCNGLDDDCDGDVDEGEFVDGEYLKLCNDDNPCTTDQCTGADGCDYVAMTEGECADGDPCTVADHCEAGVCVGEAVDCDDGNPCTEDLCTTTGGCEHLPVGGECDDGDPCTLGDHCTAGACAGEAVNCNCQVDEDCQALEDGDPCTGTLFCNIDALPYLCQTDPATVPLCPAPEGPDAPCLAAQCDSQTGQCATVAANANGLCDDGDACTVGDRCSDGICAPGQAVNCNDGNPCTDDSCDPDTGCLHADNELACSDGNVCTFGDQCQAGACQPGQPLVCSDNNPCTDDGCAPEQGCVYTANQAPCDDGNVCTVSDFCLDGTCKPGSGALPCDDGNLCTDDSCGPVTGCTYSLNVNPCNDGNVCTLNDVCELGECVGGGPLNCDDGNLCTADLCDALGGCLHSPLDGECDDGSLCTTQDVCANGLCVGGQMVDCDDGNPCTKDTCDPAVGCTHTPTPGSCSDGDACTLGDACVEGICVSGADALDCDDDNDCTDDACDSGIGCTYEVNTATCDDGDACTPVDECVAGACVGSGELLCDDQDDCTQDSCDPGEGCLYEPITPCCGNGIAEAGEECDDGNDVDDDECLNNCTKPVCQWAGVPQLYCNGGCSWSGGSGCDQTEADTFCRLTLCNCNAHAVSFDVVTALPLPGFACTWGPGVDYGQFPQYCVNMDVLYSSGNILSENGPGSVLANVVCAVN